MAPSQWLGSCACSFLARGDTGMRITIAFAQGLHHLITQIVLGTHEPVALLARLAPLQQESGAEVGTPEQGNRMIQTAQFG